MSPLDREPMTSYSFLPRDAMRKRGLCCRPVSVRPSRSCILSRWLTISSKFLFGLLATSL